MEQTIMQLLESTAEGAKGEVERAKEKWRQQIQDLVRNLTGLRLTHIHSPKETVKLSIRVDAGLPKKVVEKIKSDVGQMELIRELLSFHKAALTALRDNCKELLTNSLFDKLRDLGWSKAESYRSTIESTLKVAEELLREAEQAQVIRKILEIDEDVLGEYSPEGFHSGKITLYWMVIGAVARWLGVSVEGLTVVVLTHEMVHAYTHLGTDIDGLRCCVCFLKAKPAVREGLAQYFTHEVLNVLRVRGHEEFWRAYERLLKHQGGPYREHENWLKNEYTPEVVRAAYLAFWGEEGEVTIEKFRSKLSECAQLLGRDSKRDQTTQRQAQSPLWQ
ncbi:hypothetical protein Q2T83_18325 (plasmid) [Fervidibacter sacchari]|uniref:ElaB/YqjD/DUF883 family membrane-anchored ribosome-binding protein n=1 Tax=Candidatus Fervidibacter sacchari TaxID=1448929 RepID=A0ABT2ETN3_9BACT|nr:hypothetical protein [Candidatus Fervidibacter sacchari]MCS3921321.1 ElaB/YqjD/DUF883 family membrane-anchored ribosome-binding protein [Candidatus Fervidibacter sacchari]WKU18081.1 hypothetical protein Q2T83_18325 [Candidatus Fervidibacter sacchari]